jgi:cytochrome d ubiquinol oxidase subunit II
MELLWYLILGLFFAGYLVLAGYDYGVGLVLPANGKPAERREALTAVGPYFLGNEVWLVAAVGILFGAFPRLEGELIASLYPAVLAGLGGAILVTAAVQLRGRVRGDGPHRGWDALIAAGATLAAGGWGAVLGGLLQGVPVDARGHVPGYGHLLTPVVATCALTLIALAATHGAAFLALRLPADRATRFAATARGLVVPAIAAVIATTVVGILSPEVRAAVSRPLPVVLLPAALIGALLVARAALDRRRPGVAFAATAVTLALPALLIGAALYPFALVSTVDPAASLPLAVAAADPATLRLLSWIAIPLLPALLGFQAMLWWVFRGRLDAGAPVFW